MLKNSLFFALLLVGAGLVLYLSWVTRPQMSTIWFVPDWVANWADERRNDTLRTAVPFVPLGWLVGAWLIWHNRPWRQWLLAWGALVTLVTLAEAGQLFRYMRSFDLDDIAWGAAGSLLGLGTAAAMWGLVRAVQLSRRG
jgi:hypothetical protein